MDLNPALVLSAAGRLRQYIIRTPFERSAALSEACGSSVYLKLENLQRTGSFKARGAFSRVTRLTPAERDRGIITISSGNHAQGVALAGGTFGIGAVVVMPEVTPVTKVRAAQRYGAEVRLVGKNYDEAEAVGTEMAAESGMTFVSSYADPDVAAGQGTVGLEMMMEQPDLDIVLVPCGGGGLMSGVSCIVKSINPRARVFGVQSEASPAWHSAFENDRVTYVPFTDSLAEGLSGQITAEMYDLAKRWIDGILLVSEDDIAGAMVWMMAEHNMIVEGSGAVGLAALLSHRIHTRGLKTAVVVSGGNVDVRRVRDLLQSRV